MNELVLNCFLCNAMEVGKLRVIDLDSEEDEQYMDFKITMINNKIHISENGILKKEYNIKKMKLLYESQNGDEVIVKYKGNTIRFCI